MFLPVYAGVCDGGRCCGGGDEDDDDEDVRMERISWKQPSIKFT